MRIFMSLLLVGCAVSVLSVAGCSKRSAALTQTQSKAFDSAAPDVKQVWDQALAADAATNYVQALKSLKSLRGMQLNEEQLIAVDKEAADFNQRLFAAAAKNDPAAVQAVQFMRSQR